MLKDLVNVANSLDSLGLFKEADLLDNVVKNTLCILMVVESVNLQVNPKKGLFQIHGLSLGILQ